jgi:hypothetical protein
MRQYAQQFSLRGSGIQLDPAAFVINAVNDNITPEAPLQRRPAKAQPEAPIVASAPKAAVAESRRQGGRSAGIEEDSYNLFSADESEQRIPENRRSWLGYFGSMLSFSSSIVEENNRAKPAELSSYTSSHGLLDGIDVSTRSVGSEIHDSEVGANPRVLGQSGMAPSGETAPSKSSHWISRTPIIGSFLGYAQSFSERTPSGDDIENIINSETVSSRKRSI